MTLIEFAICFTLLALMCAVVISPILIPSDPKERRKMGVRLPGDND
jgi:hypothetical protein